MEIKCPKCRKEVSGASINVNTDLGRCDYCNYVFKLSDYSNYNELSKISTSPFGSKISVVKKGDLIEITLPAKKFGSSDISSVLILLFMIGFITLWTIKAAGTGIGFVLFSIPFWFVAISMLVNFLNSLDEDHIITLHSDRLELDKNRPINSKNYSVQYNNIYSIRIGNVATKNPFSMNVNFRALPKFRKRGSYQTSAPTINLGNKTIIFFEQASSAEQEWIVKLLNAVLKLKKTKSVT